MPKAKELSLKAVVGAHEDRTVFGKGKIFCGCCGCCCVCDWDDWEADLYCCWLGEEPAVEFEVEMDMEGAVDVDVDVDEDVEFLLAYPPPKPKKFKGIIVEDDY